jgi:beta-lactamase regulating signal transducer with metallopeptidase domain
MTLPQWEAAGLAFVSGASVVVLRSLFLAGVCACIAWLLRSRTAALRFMLWRWMLLALLALPLLTHVIPPLFKRSVVATVFLSAPVASSGTPQLDTKPLSKREATGRQVSWLFLLPGFYLFVAVVLLARLGYSRRRLRRITERSQFISDAPFQEVFHQVWLESGAGLRPRIVASNAVSAPVTFDAGESWILLPQSRATWGEQKLRAVLTHEMAHVRRRDAATLLLASFATCLFWFHPLSWFLRRQLAALAEEACDEAVLANGTAPEQYANLLIDFARDVQVIGAIGVAGRSSLKRRIELLFADTQNKQRGIKTLAALAFVLFIPALYLAAAAQPGVPEAHQRNIAWPSQEQVTSLTPQAAEALEAALKANPEDLDRRVELLLYFSKSKQEIPFTNQLLWFIHHHPETESLPMAEMLFHADELLSQKSRDQIHVAWEKSIADHPGSLIVLFNAANSLQKTDPERGLQLLREAEALDLAHREKYDHGIAVIYATAELQRLAFGGVNNIQMNEALGIRPRGQLRNSRDPALLAETGRLLTQLTLPGGSGEPLHRGLALIRAAIQLDPGNAQWTEALQSAEAEPQRALNYERIRRSLAVANAAK